MSVYAVQPKGLEQSERVAMDAHDDPRTADRAEANAVPDAHASSGTDVKPKPRPSALLLFLACLVVIMGARIYYCGLWRPVLLPMGLFYGALTSAPMSALCLLPQLFVPRRLKSRPARSGSLICDSKRP